jgi:hypothetical protein
MGDGGRTTTTTSTTTSTPAKPESKSKGSKKSTKVVAKESVEVTDLYSEYMNRFLKG